MKGPHDDNLKWPLKVKFIVKQLLNQVSDNLHYQKSLIYEDKRVTERIVQLQVILDMISLFPMKISTMPLHNVSF